MSGIFQFLVKSEYPSLHYVGVPYIAVENQYQDFVEPYMFAALSWYHEDTQGTTPRRRHGFPSWTWAGWAGPIRRMYYGFRVRVHKQHDHSLKLRVRGLLMESANGDMSPAAVYLELKEPISSCPGSAVAIRFEALAIPSTSFFFDGELGNWDTTLVCGRNTFRAMTPPTGTPAEFIQHLNDGTWSCLWMGDYLNPFGTPRCFTFLLVAEWQTAETAVRVGTIVLEKRFRERNSTEYNLLIAEEELKWVKVRLV